jgi:hypothetical protein
MGSITLESANEMALVVAELVKAGVVFKASSSSGEYKIELTGGH